MAQADALERQMLELINAERTSRGLNPVQLELRLNDAAEDHSEWMLQVDVFSHTGAGGSSPGDRMQAAGFVFSGSWRWAENIAWQSERGAPGLEDDVVDLHNGLMNSPGHRANILNPDVTVIGIGIETGDYNGWNAVIVTQNFAKTSAPLQLDSGTAAGAPAPGGTSASDDLVLSAPGTLSGLGGNDTLSGSTGDDQLSGNDGHDLIRASAGNDTILGDRGADRLYGDGGHDTLSGGNGDDRIGGGNGNDTISGDKGKDLLFGGAGDDLMWGGNYHDTVYGGAGRDTLWGEAGTDSLYGGADDDRLYGGDHDDLLVGGAGNDTLTGGAGNDAFVFGAGSDLVTDFDARNGAEQIDLTAASGITGYADLRVNHLSSYSGGVIIDDLQGNRMVLQNVSLADLDAGDFLF